MAKTQNKTISGRRRFAGKSTSFVTPKGGPLKLAQKTTVKSGKEMVGSFVEVVDVRPSGHLLVREAIQKGNKIRVIGSRSGKRMAVVAEKPEAAKLSVEHLNQEGDEIIARVTDWAGGANEARRWYRSYPIPAFGDRTAESLVKTGHAEQVREYLDAVATGTFS